MAASPFIATSKAGPAFTAASAALCPPAHIRPEPRGCCVNVDTPIDRPDPATYSQAEQFALSAQPTWNNPDITTNAIGQGTLLPEAQVVVRNRSATASAIGANVRCYVSRFGIGYDRTLFGTATTNLAPGEQKTLSVPFTQAILAGEQRIAFHVRIEHSTDPILINNAGAHTLDSFATSVQGRSIETNVPVRNPLAQTQSITLQQLSTPPGIWVIFSSDPSPFGPFEERQSSVLIKVNDSLIGSANSIIDREVTLVARGADGQVIDGVTFYVAVDS
jgi:hypothetical protein